MIDKILEQLGSMTFFTGEMIGADYAHDEFPGGNYLPEAVVEATSTEDVVNVIKLCSEYDVPVTVRGAGTGQVGGSVPIHGGIVLSLRNMNQIISFDEEKKTLTVQPGVLLQEVKAEAAKHGLFYPPDPGEQTATIGGNVSTNASGPCAVKYGSTKDYVMDAVVVRADGSAVRLSEAADVIGSEGTLGVITEIVLKLIEKPGADVILLFPFTDGNAAIEAAKAIVSAGYDPAVLEYLDTDFVEFSGNVTGNPVFPVEMDGERIAATLMVTLEGNDEDAVMEKMEAIAEMAEELACVDILVGDTTTMKKDMWAAHDAFHLSVESGAKCACEINVNVPINSLAEVIRFSKSFGEQNGLKVMVLGHAGSGGLHIHAVSDCSKDTFAGIIPAIENAVYAKTEACGGDIRGEYGIGYAKVNYNKAKAGDFAARKAVFDPKGILNPGKII